MATQWIMSTIHNAIAPTISGAVQTAGSFAGDAVNGVGSSINGVGEGINQSIRRYGDGTKDYGNAIKDWTKAPGARSATASNPLGLSDSAAGGKSAINRPMYRPIAPAPQQKALPAPKAQKALPAPAVKPATAASRKPATGTAGKSAAAATKTYSGPGINKLPPPGPTSPSKPKSGGSGVPLGAKKPITTTATYSKPTSTNNNGQKKTAGSGIPLGAKKPQGPTTTSGVKKPTTAGKVGGSSSVPMGAKKR